MVKTDEIEQKVFVVHVKKQPFPRLNKRRIGNERALFCHCFTIEIEGSKSFHQRDARSLYKWLENKIENSKLGNF